MRRYATIFAVAMLLITGAWGSTLGQNPEWMVYTPDNSDLPTGYMWRVAVDSQGSVWVSPMPFDPMSFDSRKYGILKFDGQMWMSYTTENSGLPYDKASPIGFDDQGSMWIATGDINGQHRSGGGIAKFDGESWTVYNMDNSALPSNNIWCGTIDHEGNIWVGMTAGVGRFDGETWTVYDKEDLGMPSDLCSGLAVDLEGNIWAGNYDGGGVARFDGETWTAYTPENSGMVSKPDNSVIAIAIDLQGNKWFGTFGHVVKFDDETWTVYTPENSDLPSNGWSLAVDLQGNLWAGSAALGPWFHDPKGVAKFDGETWTVYTPENSGLPGTNVYALAADGYGNMWMATSGGLAVYRKGGVILPGTPTPVEETSAAGMPSEFSLSQNHPNPFNPETTLRYDVPETGTVLLAIYALTGQSVRTLVAGERSSGTYSIVWDGTDDAGRALASGVYLCRMESGGFNVVRKLVLVR